MTEDMVEIPLSRARELGRRANKAEARAIALEAVINSIVRDLRHDDNLAVRETWRLPLADKIEARLRVAKGED